MTLGKKIKELRQQRGWTQADFASSLHVTQGAISQWENGSTCPDITQLATISQLFDVTIDSLLLENKEARPTTALRLRSLMSMKKMELSSLAAQTSISHENILHFISGAYVPSYSETLRLAKALNVSADYLLCRTDNPKRSPNIDEEEQQFSMNILFHRDAEVLYRRPGMRILFDAAKDAPDEVLQKTADLLEAMKNGYQT